MDTLQHLFERFDKLHLLVFSFVGHALGRATELKQSLFKAGSYLTICSFALLDLALDGGLQLWIVRLDALTDDL